MTFRSKKTGKKSDDSIHDHSQSHRNLPKQVTLFSHGDERFSIAERFPKISILQPIILVDFFVFCVLEPFSSLQPLLWYYMTQVRRCPHVLEPFWLGKKTSWSASSLQDLVNHGSDDWSSCTRYGAGDLQTWWGSLHYTSLITNHRCFELIKSCLFFVIYDLWCLC